MGNKLATEMQQRGQQIRRQRDAHIVAIQPKLQKLYSQLNLSKDKQQRLLNAPAHQLVHWLNSGETTSYELVVLFAYRSATVGFEKLWITEENYEEAVRMAKDCDENRARTKGRNRTAEDREAVLPELYGVPLSVKDTIEMKGFASTIGVVSKYDRKFEEDGVLMQVARKSGMIPFVRSNIPQLTMTFESVNNMFGRAVNPWDETRATGGSSGGEAALIAGRCSPIGFGSDLGGSQRIPAEFCGVYAIKTSSYRYTMEGHTFYSASISGNVNIPGVAGPIGKSVQDLALFVNVFTDQTNYTKKNMDVNIKLLPFDFRLYRDIPVKLRIGFFDNLEFMPTTPASRRAVNMVVEKLKAMGYQIVEARIPNENEVIGEFFEFIAAEGKLRGYRDMLQGEKMIDEYMVMEKTFVLPGFLYGGLSKIISIFKKRLGFLLQRVAPKSAYQYLKLSNRQHQSQKLFIQMWKDKNLDFIICPGFGSQAQKHGYSKFCNLAAAYTFVWNVLEMVAGTMPITRVREDEEVYGNYHNDPANHYLIENVKGSRGLPVGVQVIGLPYQEERVLGLMKVIQKEFPFYKENAFPM